MRSHVRQLNLDQCAIQTARTAASSIAGSVLAEIEPFTTDSIERLVLRFMGVDGINDEGVPLPNVVVDALKSSGIIDKGSALWMGAACSQFGSEPREIARDLACGRLRPGDVNLNSYRANALQISRELTAKTLARIDATSAERNPKRACLPADRPLFYLIVATGNIHDDVVQARCAVKEGADCIAVIRSTAQSLLDYVPHGVTTEGYGGTYATQENFRIMREALDEEGTEVGRYIRLVNYSSGLCMPEIAGIAAVEGLDMLLNDAMYGILFRDINMIRTLIDQRFSRMIIARAGLTINTGEDNYLTTSDALTHGHTVLASQLINAEFARRAGLPPGQIALGHAFEIDPTVENSLCYEIAQALLCREIFPDHLLKYMPPTKHITGDIFRAYLINGMYNLVAHITSQDILLLGMLTEAIHTPFLSDRYLALQNVSYVSKSSKSLPAELLFSKSGIINDHARKVLDRTVRMLREIESTGLFGAIELGMFAGIKRSRQGGKGLEGVIRKSPDYYNPLEAILAETSSGNGNVRTDSEPAQRCEGRATETNGLDKGA